MGKVFVVNREYAFSSLERVERFIKKREGWDMEIRQLPQRHENHITYEVIDPVDGDIAVDANGNMCAYLVDIFNVDEECDDYETPDCSPAGEPC